MTKFIAEILNFNSLQRRNIYKVTENMFNSQTQQILKLNRKYISIKLILGGELK